MKHVFEHGVFGREGHLLGKEPVMVQETVFVRFLLRNLLQVVYT